MSSEQWKPIGPGHWRQNEDPMLFNRPSLPGRDICDWIPDQPITVAALKAENDWEYMQWNGVVDEWYRQFAPPHYGHSNCVGVRFNEYKGETGPRVYLFLTSSYCRLPGCTTMAQLRALLEMLEGE